MLYYWHIIPMAPTLPQNRKTGTSSERWDISRIPDLHGKVAIVTGANSPSGIGFHTAYQLAVKGAKVYIGARSHEKANYALKELKNKAPNRALDLDTFVADMGNLKEIVDAAKIFAAKETRLDILINNAAVVAAEERLDTYGISFSFTTNHLGPFTLTRELLPILKKTAIDSPSHDVRVVMIASELYRLCGPRRFRGPEDFNFKVDNNQEGELTRYSYSKLANILFTKQLQKKFSEDDIPIQVIAVHPGRIMSAGLSSFMGEDGIEANKATMITVEEGSLTSLFAATDPIVHEEKQKYAGGYVIPYGTIDEVSDTANDENLAKELWESSEKIVDQVLVL